MFCPFCKSTSFDFVEGSDREATAIFCTKCPCGLQDNTKTLGELKAFWEECFPGDPPIVQQLGIQSQSIPSL
jgi:hypothetical protein